MMTIGEVAARAAVPPSTIRYYERVGILPRPDRISGRRAYDPEVLDFLGAIRVSKQAGFTLVEIRALFRGFPRASSPSGRWRTLARQKLLEVDALVEDVMRMKRLLEEGIRCRCTSLADCSLVDRERSMGT